MRNLAIARAGDTSRHKTWLSDPSKKNFDLLVAYFGEHPGTWREHADRYDHWNGLKYPWFEHFLRENRWVFDYDAIWLADDDLEADTATVSDAFDIFQAERLLLAQPALTHDSVVCHEMMRRKMGCYLRYVGFVEEQMPIFSRECLGRIEHTMGETISGWGLGVAWAKILGHPLDKMAVIDAAPMKHIRPLGQSDMYKKILPELGKDPFVELEAMKARYQDDMRMDVFREVPFDPEHPRSKERYLRQYR